MKQLGDFLKRRNISGLSKDALVDEVIKAGHEAGYIAEEVNKGKPWGAYVRFSFTNAEAFLHEFFPSLDFNQACLGREDVELSPKILVVAPGQRLSWQYHFRRAERWKFLTDGAFNKSSTDTEGEVSKARAGDEIQFLPEERHRLIGHPEGYVIVAEIWQHTEPGQLSDEDDIIRLLDDYRR